jgi:hypothetical protein
MTGFLGNSMMGAGQSGGIDTGDIANSLRFRSAASAYLSRTFGTPTNNKIFTFNSWIKQGTLTNGVYPRIFSAAPEYIRFDDTSGVPTLYASIAGGTFQTTEVFRDPTSWWMLTVAVDTTQATASNRVKFYKNGVQITSFSTATYPALNAAASFNSAIAHHLGWGAASQYFDGYMARPCLVDGSQLTPSSFGYLNSTINEWVTKTASEIDTAVVAGGGWGNNGDLWDFDDATSLTTLGYGKFNSVNWTLNNFSLTAGVTYDHTDERPGDSFAVLNSLYGTAHTYSNGNLKVVTDSTGYKLLVASQPFPAGAGKWVWQVKITSSSGYDNFGLYKLSVLPANTADSIVGSISGSVGYLGWTGQKNVDGTASAFGATLTTGDYVRFEFDATAGSLQIFKNNTSQGTITGLSTSDSYIFAGSDYSNSSATYEVSFGQIPWFNSETPTTGFLALCQANLENTTVTVSGTFTGNGAADGPFVWINGVPKTLTINGNAVTFGTHADKTAGGFKLRTSSASYNTAGSNTWTATIDSNLDNCFKYRNAQGNP